MIRSLECQDSMFLASHLLSFWERIQKSSVEPSFSPAPVTQWVNAGLKSHWLMLSDSGWQLQGNIEVFGWPLMGVCVSKHLISLHLKSRNWIRHTPADTHCKCAKSYYKHYTLHMHVVLDWYRRST